MKTCRHAVAVHWGDTDPAKIVFYPRYFERFGATPHRQGVNVEIDCVASYD